MKHKFIVLTLLFITVLFSCKKDNIDIDSEYPNNVKFIKNDINVTTTWYSDTIYVIDNSDLYVDAALTIQAGTIIKFQSTKGAYIGLDDSGTIIANGTVSNPIIFTSFKDDAHGGDSNIDETATSPAAGDWDHMNMNDVNGSSFNYCEFYYGGNGSTYTLTLYGSENTTVTNCTFAHNRGGKSGDFYYGALDASNAEAGTVITDNVFYDNNLPLSVSTSFNLDASNTFHNPNDLTEINTMNGIFVYAIDEISTVLNWSETEVAYVINDNDLWIDDGFSLNIANDVVLKFTASSELIIAIGGDINQGSGNFFTSFKDDTKKGDTNGDEAVTTPAAGDWGGIYNDQTSNYHVWANILYDSH